MTRQISRRQFIKGLSVAGFGAAGAQLLAACAPAAPAPGAAPDAADAGSAPAATDVTLRVQVPATAEAVMPTTMAQRYQDESGVEVLIEETIYTEIETKTQTGFISNTLQDLLYGHHRWLFINYLKGIYMEIDDMMASDPLPDYEDIYPSVMAGNAFDGKNFSVPGVVHPGGNIAVNFNITMLEEKGLPLPQIGWTMQDWEELARAAADPENGIFGMGFDGMNSFHYYSNTSRSFGDPGSTESWVMNEDGTEFIFNTPLHEEIGNWYVTLLNDRIAPRKPDYIEESPGNIFIAGLNATHASIVGNVANFLNQIDGAFEMDAVPLPVGPEGRQGTCYSGNQHMISTKTAHPEEAYELLKMFSSGEAGVLMVLEGKLQPNGHKSAWTDAQVNEVNKMYGITDELLSAGIEPFPMPRNTRFTEANTTFLNDIDLVWEGEVSWAEQAPIIVEKVQAVLDMERP
jgi:multiple sugar transport system substrate-binding protein